MRPKTVALVAPFVLAACATTPAPTIPAAARATILSSAGEAIGTVDLVPSGDGYQLAGTVAGLSPGMHGIHLHAVGACNAPDFTTAGGHLNPGLHQHGSMNPSGEHLGDLPNLVADRSGSAKIALGLRGTRADLDRDLFDTDGTALVVHAGPDDYRTDPSGNSGKRIACGVLQRN